MKSKLVWKPDAAFTVSGFVMETLIGLLTEKLMTAQAQQTIREYECLKMLQQLLEQGVADGKVSME